MRMGFGMTIGARSRGWTPQSLSDTWHKELSGNQITESLLSTGARIYPSGAKSNGTDDLLSFAPVVFTANNSLWFRGGFTDALGANMPIIGNASNLKYFQMGSGGAASVTGAFMGETDTNGDFLNFTTNFTLEANVVYDIVLLNKGSGNWELFIDGVSQGTDTTTNETMTVVYAFARATTFGKGIGSFLGIYSRLLTETEIKARTIVNSDLKVGFHLTGKGLYEYDISGNGVNGTWAGTGAHFDYFHRASTYYLVNGWKKYTKAGQKDEIVPLTGDVTTIVAAGYVLAATYPAGAYYNRYPTKVRFREVVNATSTAVPSSGVATEGTAGAGTVTLLLYDLRQRLRQTGKVKYIQFYYDDNTPENTTSVKIQVWRKSTLFDKIHEVDITASTVGTSDGVKTIKFTPELSVQEGDFWAFEIVNSGANLVLYGIATDALANSIISYAGAPDDEDFAWESQTGVQRRIIINSFMVAPAIAGIGDSNIAGWSTHRSYVDLINPNITNLTAPILYQLKQLNSKLEYQNIGRGGNTMAQVLARLRFDGLNAKPRIMLVHGGINDIAAAVADATIINTTMEIIRRCISADIIPVYLHITPWTAGTNEQLQTRDTIKTAIAAACDALNVLHIDAQSVLGQFRVGGDEGNLWDQIPALKEDDGHFKPAGYVAWAAYVYAAMVAEGLVFEDYNPAKFDIFDRSNATIHAAASREATDYTALQPYEYDLENLIDYTTYNGFLEAAYKDRIFSKVEDSILKEIFGTAAQLTGGNLTSMKAYCGIV